MIMRKSMDYYAVRLESIDEKRVVNGIVKKFYKDTLIIHITEEVNLENDEEVLINIFRKNKATLVYSGTISNILDNTIEVKKIRVMLDKENRNGSRIIVQIPLGVTRIRTIPESIIDLDKPICMMVKNLSNKGLLLECNLDMPKDINFFIEMPIENEKLHIETITKRKYKKDDLYYYGCEFILEETFQNYALDSFILKNYNNKFFKYYGR